MWTLGLGFNQFKNANDKTFGQGRGAKICMLRLTCTAKEYLAEAKLTAEPIIFHTREQRTAVIHLTVPHAEIKNIMEEVLATLEYQGIKPVGSLFTGCLKWPTGIVDIEVGFSVDLSNIIWQIKSQ